jgi:hypothetical protein
MRLLGAPYYEVEFEDGERLQMPPRFRNGKTNAMNYHGRPILTHPMHNPVILTPHGWRETKPDFSDCEKLVADNYNG